MPEALELLIANPVRPHGRTYGFAEEVSAPLLGLTRIATVAAQECCFKIVIAGEVLSCEADEVFSPRT